MNKTIAQPRTVKKSNTPELETLTVPSHKRGRFLGIGGLNLKKILTQTGWYFNMYYTLLITVLLEIRRDYLTNR